MDPASILKIITNSTWIVTQLLGENPFHFTQNSYEISISEDSPPRPLLQLSVEVRSREVRLRFELVSGNSGGQFRIDPNKGLLSLTNKLDYEISKKHSLVVRASFLESWSEIKILVSVLDANDHPPEFQRRHHETQVTEEDDRDLPKVILKVSAKDDDDGNFGLITYSLVAEDESLWAAIRERFQINKETGEISVLKPLDRDVPTGRSQWSFSVLATDGEFNASSTVVVNVKDVNDNAPFFPREVLHTRVFENQPEGAALGRVFALDRDDASEGANARLRYSLQKNVVDEVTSHSIFVVDPVTGRISTALCCLDRETTPYYTLQVVATDGGGLKGTGTVLVTVSDENDVPPKLSRAEWDLEIEEELPLDQVLATLTVIDPDITNNFEFRIVKGSGRGWDSFRLSSGNRPASDLFARVRLDYENPEQRSEFRFQVQVCDKGANGWDDKYHVDSAWVNVRIRDRNDNEPHFIKTYHYLRVREDLPLWTPIGRVTAIDADGGGKNLLQYRIETKSDQGALFQMKNGTGVIRLRNHLDRESASSHRLFILATDHGEPIRTATATFLIDVMDVNDNAPFLKFPHLVTIQEGSPPSVVANLTLDDPDDWGAGHGPPFALRLDPKAAEYIKRAVSVEFDSEAKGGVGVGVIRTKTSLDREKHRQLTLPLIATDAGGEAISGLASGRRQSATLTFTLALTDVNDNKMMPASKRVLVHLTQSKILQTPSSSLNLPSTNVQRVPLGRVFVLDPDDADLKDKTFRWNAAPERFFHLDFRDGALSMEPWTLPGTYFLNFLVTDSIQRQNNIPANVTVFVKTLSQSDLRSALPIDIEEEAITLVRQNKNTSESMVDLLTKRIKIWIQFALKELKSWTHDNSGKETRVKDPDISIVALNKQEEGQDGRRERPNQRHGAQSPAREVTRSRIWISGGSSSSVSLQHILIHRKTEMEELVGARISLIGFHNCEQITDCSSGCWVRPIIGDGYALVDANTSSIVGPNLRLDTGCGCQPTLVSPTDTIPESPFFPHPVVKESLPESVCGEDGVVCLNGGRCAPQHGQFRCICPHGTEGPRCKVTERFFSGEEEEDRKIFTEEGEAKGTASNTEGNSWAWLPELPSCAEVHLSFEFLTKSKNGILVFSGNSAIQKEPQILSKKRRLRREEITKRKRKILDKNGKKEEGQCDMRIATSKHPLWKNPRLMNDTKKGMGLSSRSILAMLDSPQGSNSSNNNFKVKSTSAARREKLTTDSEKGHKNFSGRREFCKHRIRHRRSNGRKYNKDTVIITTATMPQIPPNEIQKPKSFESASNQKDQPKDKCLPKFGSSYISNSPSIFSQPFSLVPYKYAGKKAKTSDIWTVEKFKSHTSNQSSSKNSSLGRSDFPSNIPKRRKLQWHFGKLSGTPKPDSGEEEGDQREFLNLFLKEGKPHLLLNLGGGNIALSLPTALPLSDYLWHRIDIIWRDQLVEMILDLCSGGSVEHLIHPSLSTSSTSHRLPILESTLNITPTSSPPDAWQCRIASPIPAGGKMFNYGGPIQIGGIATRQTLVPPTNIERNDVPVHPFPGSFRGCIRNFRINGEVQDLGHGVLSYRSMPGCPAMSCQAVKKACSNRASCVGSPGKERCECLPGWTGPECNERTEPVRFGDQSFATLALSFTPLSFATTLQLRLRTRSENGELISLSSRHGKYRLALFLRGGQVCLSARLHPELPSFLCLTHIHLNDGEWHLVKAMRVGSGLILVCDDGDGLRYNALLLLDGPPLLQLSRHDGLHVGGIPEYINGHVRQVHDDYAQGCIDDLRLQGRSLPLPPSLNLTQWGQVTRLQHVIRNCPSSKLCLNASCSPPLTCMDKWEMYQCGCPQGSFLSAEGDVCLDVDECHWEPCLQGGVCHNTAPEYSCSCPAGFSGFHCQLKEDDKPGSFPTPVFLSIPLLFSFLIVIIVLFGRFVQRRRKIKRRHQHAKETGMGTIIPGSDFEMRCPPQFPCQKNLTNYLPNSEKSALTLCPPDIPQNQLFAIGRQEECCRDLPVVNTSVFNVDVLSVEPCNFQPPSDPLVQAADSLRCLASLTSEWKQSDSMH